MIKKNGVEFAYIKYRYKVCGAENTFMYSITKFLNEFFPKI